MYRSVANCWYEVVSDSLDFEERFFGVVDRCRFHHLRAIWINCDNLAKI